MCYDCTQYIFCTNGSCRLEEADGSVIGICSKECEHFQRENVICDPRLNGRSRSPWPHGPRFPNFVCSEHEQCLLEGKELTPKVYHGIKSWIFNDENASYIKDEDLRRTLQEEIMAKQTLDLTADALTRAKRPPERVANPPKEKRPAPSRSAVRGATFGKVFRLKVRN